MIQTIFTRHNTRQFIVMALLLVSLTLSTLTATPAHADGRLLTADDLRDEQTYQRNTTSGNDAYFVRNDRTTITP